MTTPTKYRKKPVEVEAVRFEKPYHQVAAFCPEIQLIKIGERGTKVAFALITTREGAMRAELGDWIIRGVQGEFYPCKPDLFEQTYEAIDTPALSERERVEVERFGIHDEDRGEASDA